MEATIIDVSPRDGLQNESVIVSTADKLALIEGLVGAGVANIEAASFVNPKLVPAMADADIIMREVPRHERVRYIGLVLNERGLDRATEGAVDEANIVVVATDTFSRKNQNTTTKEGIEIALNLARRASEVGVEPSVTVAAAFGCPFEGEVSTQRVVDVVRELMSEQFVRINIADTIGVGTPLDVTERLAAIAPLLPAGIALGTHFHNTRNMGYANAFAAWDSGATHFDSSLGGVGGCPFAPNATGNIATDDLLYMFDRMGVQTDLDLSKLIDVSKWLEGPLNKAVSALLPKAGIFPGETS